MLQCLDYEEQKIMLIEACFTIFMNGLLADCSIRVYV